MRPPVSCILYDATYCLTGMLHKPRLLTTFGPPQAPSAEANQILLGDEALLADDGDAGAQWQVEWAPGEEDDEDEEVGSITASRPVTADTNAARTISCSRTLTSCLLCLVIEWSRSEKGQAATGGDAVLRHRKSFCAGGRRRQGLRRFPPRKVCA